MYRRRSPYYSSSSYSSYSAPRRCDDEGYYHKWCDACGRRTEHDGEDCFSCDERAAKAAKGAK